MLDLNKGDLLIRADDEFKLYCEALEMHEFKIAYKHIVNAQKLKSICAYVASASGIEEKSRLYLEASRFAAMAGDDNKSKSLAAFSADIQLDDKAHNKSLLQALKKYPSKYETSGVRELHYAIDYDAPMNIGDVFLLDEVSCRCIHSTSDEDGFVYDGLVCAKSDYAVCLSHINYSSNVYYLISARKLICEYHDHMRFYGININADFNFMPSEKI